MAKFGPDEDIKQTEGFKNISLGNVILNAYQNEDKIQFLSDADSDLMKKYKVIAFEIQVGLHELFGHGCGKLFRIDDTGKLNFDRTTVRNPLTGQPIDMWYEMGESYTSKFGTIGQSFEECRAESVALYLSLNREVVKLFGYTDAQEIEDIVYVGWLLIIWIGVAESLQNYNLANRKWGQAHRQARFVIMRALLEAGQGLVRVDETEKDQNLLLSVDRSKIDTIGKEAIRELLMKIQVCRSTGDVVGATKLYNHYSVVSDSGTHPWAKWQKIVMMHIKPRKILTQANTERKGMNYIHYFYL